VPDPATAPVEIFLASRNPKKLAEMARILGEHLPGVEVLGLDDVAGYDEPVEDQPDFSGNALLKARAGVAATGLPSLADDSGLCVDALNGMPGVLSARWSGDLCGDDDRDAVNLRLLLGQIADVPDERRGASFECAAVAVFPDGDELVAHGRIKGTLTRAPRGTGGFGYDPIFLPTGSDGTTAEMSAAEKDAISHRGRAFRALARLLVSAEAVDEGSGHE
jgi:XTP/dITP diphosphohydrolase